MPNMKQESVNPGELLPGDFVYLHPYVCIVHDGVYSHDVTLNDGKTEIVYELTLIYPVEPYLRTIIRLDDEEMYKLSSDNQVAAF